MGELPALGKIKWKGPCLPENYQPPGGISKGLVRTRDREGRLLPSSTFKAADETTHEIVE